MDFLGTGTLEKIALNTDSIIIVFLIVLILALVLAGIPLYRAYSKNKQAARESNNQREGMLISVIAANTTANVKLSTVLERLDNNCNDCKSEQLARFDKIIVKQDATLQAVNETHSIIDERLDRRIKIKPVVSNRRKEA